MKNGPPHQYSLSKIWQWIRVNAKTLSVLSTLGLSSITYTYYYFTSKAPAQLHVSETLAVDLLGAVNSLPGLPLNIAWRRPIGAYSGAKTITHLHVVIITFENSGDIPFDWATRVRQPITFSIKGNGEILDSVKNSAAKTAPDLNFEKFADSGQVSVATQFLNAHESFSIVLFHTSDVTSSVDLSGRIFDQPSLALTRTPLPAIVPAPFSVSRFLIEIVLVTIGSIILRFFVSRLTRRPVPSAPPCVHPNDPHLPIAPNAPTDTTEPGDSPTT